MIRVVLDTNIIVSAHLVSSGLPDQIFNLALNRWMELCVSPLIMAEYEEVLRRPRLDLDSNKIATALARIREVSVTFSPTQSVAVCPDADDNIFLECAQAGKADYLVTGNRRHFPARWQNTRIVTAREFHQIVADILRKP